MELEPPKELEGVRRFIQENSLNHTLLLDTSAWIEFFIKSDRGKKVREVLSTKNCYTSIVSIAEISNFAIKQNINGKDLIKYVKGITKIIELTEKISFFAGELNYERKMMKNDWGMLDSFILSTALMYNMKILTKDNHFKDLPNVEMI